MEMPDEVRKFFEATGAKGGKARAKNNSKEVLTEQGEKAAATRWRNYHVGEHDLHGTPIPEKYAVAVAAMTKEERAKALRAAKKRQGNTTERPRASEKSE